MSAPKPQGTDAQNDTAPGNWYATDAEIARWRHPSGALVRIRRELPLRDTSSFNRAEHTDAEGQLTVLYHTQPLPSQAEEIHRGGTVQDARTAARKAMLRRPEADR